LNCAETDDNAESSPLATILLVLIAIILSAVLLSHVVYLPSLGDDPVPTVYEITSVRHTNEYGVLNYDSYVVLTNTGTVARKNKDLFVKTFVNGFETQCNIPTLNGEQFCNSVHTDVATIGGLGARGSPTNSLSRWYPTHQLAIDYENGMFHPSDTITIDVYDRTTGKIVSRDNWPHRDLRTTASWWISFFTHQVA
jgi:flagellin-like protein